MLNLIKLECKKYKFNGHWLGVLIANVSILALIGLMFFDPSVAEEILPTYNEALSAIETFVRVTFIVFASVLISKYIIEEYKSKTMSLMFTYPVNRKKLIAAKLIIIYIWTTLAIIVSNIIITSVFLLLNKYFGYIQDPIEMDLLVKHSIQMLVNAVATAGVSLIPLYFGMRKKSVPATIVSSVLIVSIFSSSTAGFSLYSIVAVPFVLAAIGIIIAYIAIRKVDKVDLY